MCRWLALGSATAVGLRIFWGVCALASALYLIWWDIKMDWGLWKLDSANRLLRNHLVFRRKWVRRRRARPQGVRCVTGCVWHGTVPAHPNA